VKSNIIRGSAGLFLSLALLPAAARADDPEGPVLALKEPVIAAKIEVVHPFAALAGSWSGGGTISLTNDINERLRCRAHHTYGQSNNSLSLSIRCASDNYKFELTSNVVERRGQLSGQWKEASYNVTGTISGRVAGNRVTAVATGDKFTADLSMITQGNRQSVTITPKATYLTSVQIALSRR
jgi:autotransporter translocation and assembly factor TamB